MNAKEILMKAVQCDQAGRILEAQNHYQDGIQILMELVNDESEVAKKKVYYERIKEYIDRAEQIKERVKRHISQGDLVAHIPIDEGSTGHSYKSLFGKFVNADVKEVLIEEPYLVERYQFENLIAFLELIVKQCNQLSYILLITNRLTEGYINDIKNDLKERNIILSIVKEKTLHDRKIALSNGYYIKIGRGLHIFKFQNPNALGLFDHDFRKCLQTEYQNLIAFFELLVKSCSQLKYIRLVTKADPKNPDGQQNVFGQIKADLEKRNVTFIIKIEDSLHDRKIVLSNGYIIKIGRGLHFFKANNPLFSLGLTDYDFRRCMQTDVDIWRTKSIS